MTQSVINRTEVLLIQMFRWVVILFLAGILIVSIWLAANGMLSLPRSRNSPEPARAAPSLVVPFNEWLADNKPKEPAQTVSAAHPPASARVGEDPAAVTLAAHANALWPIVAAYQKECSVPNPFSKEQFVDSLRQTNLQLVLSSYPDDYATSQVTFVKQALENPETIKLCLSRKVGIFLSIIEFHGKHYEGHVMRTKAFNEGERQRILEFASREERERNQQFIEAQRMLTLAAGAFGLFLSVILLLVFTRIEVNLRAIAARS